MNQRLKEIKEELQNFAKAYDLKPDWHEPDEEDVDAIVTGRHLDNACGIDQDGLPPTATELVVHLTISDRVKYSINLADLLAIACSNISTEKKLSSLSVEEVVEVVNKYNFKDSKIARIRAVRELTNCGLREAAYWVDTHKFED